MSRRPFGGAAARALGLLALALALGCSDEALGPALPSPGPKPSSPVSIADLSGAWVFGDKGEPPAGPVIGCRPDQTLTIQQPGGTAVAASVSLCGGTCRTTEKLSGQNRQGEVQLDGTYQGNLDPQPTTVRYRLTYRPETQHLVGTRDGQPFWAAPFLAESGPACPPSSSAAP